MCRVSSGDTVGVTIVERVDCRRRPLPPRKFRSCFFLYEACAALFERRETVLKESDPENIFVPTRDEVNRRM